MELCPVANNLLNNNFFPTHPLGQKLIPRMGQFCVPSTALPSSSHPVLQDLYWGKWSNPACPALWDRRDLPGVL